MSMLELYGNMFSFAEVLLFETFILALLTYIDKLKNSLPCREQDRRAHVQSVFLEALKLL